jgi:hypothetical protein
VIGWSVAAGLAVVGPLYLPREDVVTMLLVLVIVMSGFTLIGLREDAAVEPSTGGPGPSRDRATEPS